MPLRLSVRRATRHAALLLALGPLAAAAHAQGSPAPAARDTSMRDATVNVFLDCGFDCDADFVHTQITYVNWVRERTAADVHVLVTSQGTGGGGDEFTLAFLGQRRFAGVGDTLRYVDAQGNTRDETRRGLTRTLAQGLVRFVARTSLGGRLVVTLAAPSAGASASTGAAQAKRDPWNLWVYSLGANLSTSGERSSKYLSVSGNASARRTTEQWKINLGARQSYNSNSFDLGDGETSTFIRRSTTVSELAVKSLGPRLSAGVRSSLGASTFENKSFFARLTPAVEYDIFPYTESTRRVLTAQYAIGVESYRYTEQTIYLKTAETRPLHSLNVSLSQNEPWGSVNVSLDGGQYLDATYRNYGSIGGGTNVRLFKGFNLSLSGSFSSIHNQIYLPRRGATDQEILTQQRRLATSYSYYAFTGISYTFGSVLNNVVNPRFGRGDGGGGGSCFCF